MKKILLSILGLTFGFYFSPIFATWQIADPYHGTKYQKIWLPERMTKSDLPNQYTDSQITVSLKQGLLKDNIEVSAKLHHWVVQWQAPENYPLLLDTRLTGPDFPSVMNRLLCHYPLQAKYDKIAQVMAVFPADLQKHKKVSKKSQSKPKAKAAAKKAK